MKSVLEVMQLTRRYGARVALDGVSFSVQPGEIHALLGPNGAGKTTTLEIAEGLRKADGGEVRFLGERVEFGKVPPRMGVQLQASALPGGMTVNELFRFVCAWRRAPLRPDLVERLGLGGLEHLAWRQLSVGQQRRLQLALAVAHRPALVVLDEPTAGLDVATRAELHALLGELKAQGTALVLATHDMAEAEKLSDAVTVVVSGQVVAHGTPRELTRQGEQRTRISVRTAGGAEAKWTALAGATPQPGTDGYGVWLSDDAAVSVRAVLDEVQRAGDRLLDLRVERPTLEERFLELTKTTVRKEAA